MRHLSARLPASSLGVVVVVVLVVFVDVVGPENAREKREEERKGKGRRREGKTNFFSSLLFFRFLASSKEDSLAIHIEERTFRKFTPISGRETNYRPCSILGEGEEKERERGVSDPEQ